MRGAIAAGHPTTAAVGARVLAEGGNAVDAAVAAGFASWVAESPLTGPGAGGFMLVHRASDHSTRLFDFFVTVPASGADPAAMETVDVDFSSETKTPYLIGPASAAIPGVPAGLATAWKRFGTRPWPDLIEPAIALARDGVEVTGPQDYLHRLLTSILGFRPDGAALYAVGLGDRFRIPDLGDTLQKLADDGVDSFYTGELAHAICETAPQISPADLAGYRVIRRHPVTTPFRGYQFMSNPPPSSGGVLVAYGLRLLDGWGRYDAPAIVDAMRAQVAARQDASFLRSLYRGGLASRLVGPVDAPSNTTHISVIDESGNAVAMTCSTGAGSGVFVPGTGIHLNNMLGESDLAGRHRPGERLTSMMAPSICFEQGRPRLVVGSAGSARLRGAIMQIIVNVLAHGLGVKEAVERPRIHWEDGVVHAEGGADVLGLENAELVQWPTLNLFFGGANAVEIRDDDELAAAGDPRRGGDGMVVQ